MSNCGHLSNRMPSVVLGRSAWTEEESSHLAGCASCQQEWNVVSLSSGLGRGNCLGRPWPWRQDPVSTAGNDCQPADPASRTGQPASGGAQRRLADYG